MSSWLHDPRLTLRRDPVKGRCVVATAFIAGGTQLERAPVLWIPPSEAELIDRSALANHVFAWGIDPSGQEAPGGLAVALGLVSMCNHDPNPNADFVQDFAEQSLALVALRDIAAGEEITVDYGIPLWFEPQPPISA